MDITEYLDKIIEVKKIAKRLKGIKMSTIDEFDFDSLLEEIETPEKAKNETKTEENTEVDNLLDNDTLYSELVHVDASNVNTNDNDNEIEQDKQEIDYQKIIQELENTIQELQGQLKTVKTAESTDVIDTLESQEIDFDFASETNSFLKEFAEIEIEKQELNQRLRECKKEYEEQGVHTKEAIKAWKEYQKQLKETPDEAKEVEDIKRMINKDELLATTAESLIN